MQPTPMVYRLDIVSGNGLLFSLKSEFSQMSLFSILTLKVLYEFGSI